MKIAKIAVSLAGLLILCSSVSADETTAPATAETKTTAPEPAPLFQMHYKNRVRSFEEQNLVLQNIVLLGDSITEGFEVPKYLPGRRVLNRGIGGDVIGNNLPSNDMRGLLKRLDSSVFGCAPTHLFVLIGINDLGQGHSPDIMEEGYRELFTAIRKREPGLKIYVQSVLPCRGNYAKHNTNVLDVNQRLQKMAAEFKYEYLDLHSQFADSTGQLKEEYTNEGLHLSPAGYELWTKILEEKMGW